MSLADELKAQIERDRRQWEALPPTIRKSLENELAAIWPTFPRTERKEPAVSELVERLGFQIERRGDVDCVVEDEGGVYPASIAERALWSELASLKGRLADAVRHIETLVEHFGQRDGKLSSWQLLPADKQPSLQIQKAMAFITQERAILTNDGGRDEPV